MASWGDAVIGTARSVALGQRSARAPEQHEPAHSLRGRGYKLGAVDTFFHVTQGKPVYFLQMCVAAFLHIDSCVGPPLAASIRADCAWHAGHTYDYLAQYSRMYKL